MSEGRDRRRQPQAGAVPDAGRLREAALAHLSRHGGTGAGLLRVLQRRIDRWAQRAAAEGQPPESIAPAQEAARAAAAEVVASLTALGAVNDTAFAESRLRRLQRGGRSRLAMAAHLAAKGVAPETAQAALEANAPDELTAALGHLRRRRAGPFAPQPVPPEARQKALAALARAGFPRALAEQALELDPEEAADRLLAARHD